jgi:hypothetical protein
MWPRTAAADITLRKGGFIHNDAYLTALQLGHRSGRASGFSLPTVGRLSSLWVS